MRASTLKSGEKQHVIFGVNPALGAIILIPLRAEILALGALPSGQSPNSASDFSEGDSLRVHRNRRNELKNFTMSGTEEKIRLAIGSAAAAAAIFAPLGYRWKGVLTGVAAGAILTAVYGVSPMRRLLG